tara:strand:+ start:301 stop:1011 length:711 start_codon:yes stop_codon:yes gene_type:complete
LRTIWVYSNIALWTLIFGLGSYFTILLTGKKKYFRFFANIWGKTLSLIFNIKLEVDGYENLNKKDNYIFAANHCSFIDIPLLCVACKRYLVFVAKSELKKIPIFKSILDRAGFIFVDRKNSNNAINSMNILVDDISKEPRSVGIFPEGTRSRSGILKKFKKGAAVMGINTGMPVVPVLISGSHEWSRKSYLTFQKVQLSFNFLSQLIQKNIHMMNGNFLRILYKVELKVCEDEIFN